MGIVRHANRPEIYAVADSDIAGTSQHCLTERQHDIAARTHSYGFICWSAAAENGLCDVNQSWVFIGHCSSRTARDQLCRVVQVGVYGSNGDALAYLGLRK